MRINCSVSTCTNNSEADASLIFFRFPNDKARSRLFAEIIGENYENIEEKYVCFKHFDKKMVYKSELLECAEPIYEVPNPRIDVLKIYRYSLDKEKNKQRKNELDNKAVIITAVIKNEPDLTIEDTVIKLEPESDVSRMNLPKSSDAGVVSTSETNEHNNMDVDDTNIEDQPPTTASVSTNMALSISENSSGDITFTINTKDSDIPVNDIIVKEESLTSTGFDTEIPFQNETIHEHDTLCSDITIKEEIVSIAAGESDPLELFSNEIPQNMETIKNEPIDLLSPPLSIREVSNDIKTEHDFEDIEKAIKPALIKTVGSKSNKSVSTSDTESADDEDYKYGVFTGDFTIEKKCYYKKYNRPPPPSTVEQVACEFVDFTFDTIVDWLNLIRDKSTKRVPLKHALTLYLASPNGYRTYRQKLSLPKIENVLNLKKVRLNTNVCPEILDVLIKKVEMSSNVCMYDFILTIKVIALTKNILYDVRHDTIIGISDNNPELADKALVFYLNSHLGELHQAIAYHLIGEKSNAKDINKMLINIIEILQKRDLRVRCVVVPYEPIFIQIAKSHRVDAKKPMLNKFHSKQIILFMFDIGSLLKTLQKILTKHDLQFHYTRNILSNYLRTFLKHKKETQHETEIQLFSSEIFQEISAFIQHRSFNREAENLLPFLQSIIDVLKMLRSDCKYLTHVERKGLKSLLSTFSTTKIKKKTPPNPVTSLKNRAIFNSFKISLTCILQLNALYFKSGISLSWTVNNPIDSFLTKLRSELKIPPKIKLKAWQLRKGFSKLAVKDAITTSQFSCRSDNRHMDLIKFMKAERKPSFPDLLDADKSNVVLPSYVRRYMSTWDFNYVCTTIIHIMSQVHSCKRFPKSMGKSLILNAAPLEGVLNNILALVQESDGVFEEIIMKHFAKITPKSGIRKMFVSLMLFGAKKHMPCKCFPLQYFSNLYFSMKIAFYTKYTNSNLAKERAQRQNAK